MRKTIEEKQQEISEGLLEKLESGEEIEEINKFERKVLEDYYLEGKTFNEIAEDTDYTTGHCSNKKREAVERIEDNQQESADKRKEAQEEMIKQKGKVADDSFADEEHEGAHELRENIKTQKIKTENITLEETMGIDYADQEKDDTEYMLVIIQDGQAKVLSSEEQEAIDLAADSMKDRKDIDKLVAGQQKMI